jgi:hypothetical protein
MSAVWATLAVLLTAAGVVLAVWLLTFGRVWIHSFATLTVFFTELIIGAGVAV